MIRYIVAKDLRLVWPLAALLFVLHALVESARYWDNMVVEAGLTGLLQPLSMIAWVVLVAAVIHQDRPIGAQQDWLTRPIKPLHVLVAKLLVLAALLHGPLLVLNVAGLVAAGFPLREALAAGMARGLTLFVVYTLPVAALASATRSMTELLVVGIVLAVLVELLSIFDCGTTCGTGFRWVVELGRVTTITAGALLVLGLQYLRRHMIASSRAALVIVTSSVVLLGSLPWGFALVIHDTLSTADRTNDASISIEAGHSTAAPALTPLQRPNRGANAVIEARRRLAGIDEGAEVYLRRARRASVAVSVPLHIDGVPRSAILWADRVDVRLRGADGKLVFDGAGEELEFRGDAADSTHAQQLVLIPQDFYAAHRDLGLQLEMDYWLTLLEPAAHIELATDDDHGTLDPATMCRTQRDDIGQNVQLRCATLEKPPSCFTSSYEPMPKDAAALVVCNPSYAPIERNLRDLTARFGIDMPLAAASTPTAGELAPAGDSSRLRVETYEAHTHFKAHVRLADFRLSAGSNAD